MAIESLLRWVSRSPLARDEPTARTREPGMAVPLDVARARGAILLRARALVLGVGLFALPVARRWIHRPSTATLEAAWPTCAKPYEPPQETWLLAACRMP